MAKTGTWLNPKCKQTGDCEHIIKGMKCCSNGVHHCGHAAGCHVNCK